MELLIIIGLTFAPFLELRVSIPYGIIKSGFHWLPVFSVAVVTNIILGIILYFVLDFMVKLFTKIKIIDRIWQKYIEKTRKKAHAAVEKYGPWGLTVFIGIPLPGSGVYSGCVAAYLLGLDFKKTLWAIIGGVLIAAVIVTIVSVTGNSALSIFIKRL